MKHFVVLFVLSVLLTLLTGFAVTRGSGEGTAIFMIFAAVPLILSSVAGGFYCEHITKNKKV